MFAYFLLMTMSRLCDLLGARLNTEGFAVEAVHDGVRGLERARSREHSIVILDLMLPGIAGLDVLRQLRNSSRVPVSSLPLEERKWTGSLG